MLFPALMVLRGMGVEKVWRGHPSIRKCICTLLVQVTDRKKTQKKQVWLR
jgi:hypothetical protein